MGGIANWVDHCENINSAFNAYYTGVQWIRIVRSGHSSAGEAKHLA